MAQIIDKEVLNEFYKLEGEDFVHAIYGRILCRNADDGGLAAHLGALAGGTAKETLIFEMVSSEEARAKGVCVRDFRAKSVPVERLIRIAQDGAFVRTSFIAILGSNRDADAMEACEERLESREFDRLETLLDLAGREEAKVIGTEIVGLSEMASRWRRRDSLFRLPVVGESLKALWQMRRVGRLFWTVLGDVNRRVKEVRKHLAETQGAHHETRQRLMEVERRCAEMAARYDGAFEAMMAELSAAEIRRRQINEPTTGVLYKKYEDEMRGSRELIIERLKIYDSVFRNVRASNGDKICALDLGCGRGEWLELAQNTYGVHAIGVDSDVSMLSDCAKNGLTAIQGDLVEYIKGAEGDSVDIVTMFQVAEHLPVSILNEVLNECHRVLRKGGALIVETPNPENMIIGACNFHFDPTHVSKLPPPLLKILVESSGMSRAEIVRMHRYGAIDIDKDGDADTAATKQLAAFFNNFADYAVIAYKE